MSVTPAALLPLTTRRRDTRCICRPTPYAIGRRLVTNAELQAFIDDGGYRSAALWLSDGWAAVQAQGWHAPLDWLDDGKAFGLHGVQPRQGDAPVRHLSLYEAAAYAEWAGAVGEYTGKFMGGQVVLRGSSAFTLPAMRA